MTDYDFPKAPEIEEAWRVAHRSLEGIAPPGFGFAREKDLLVTEVISQFPQMVREAQIASAAQIGPLISWEGPPREKDWDLVISGIDLDGGDPDFGLVELSESAFEGPGGDWDGSALHRAALAYRREGHWDFAPGEAGVWLLTLAPVSAAGFGDKPWHCTGHLAGFVILYDRDKDGSYESVGHIWTASAWR